MRPGAIISTLDHPRARRQTFNICMDESVDQAELGLYLAERYGLPRVDIRTEYASTWLDDSKAKFLLGWRPAFHMRRMVDVARAYQRAPDDPRRTWVSGLSSIIQRLLARIPASSWSCKATGLVRIEPPREPATTCGMFAALNP